MIIVFLAFILSFSAVPFLISLAVNSGAVAIPGKRHIHTRPTPKFGGIAIASAVFLIAPFVISVDRVIGSYLLSAAVILTLGIMDDIRGAGWPLKLGFSSAATFILILGGGIWISDLGNLFGYGDVQLGVWGIPFTFFAVFGIINAVNLIDGLDGLACGVSAIAFTSFAVFASMSGNETVFYLSIANLGATLGILKYNYPRARIFMGDSGSLYLGFSIAVMAILLTQGSGTVNPMVPVIILGVPIYDTLRVLFIRIRNKRNPFLGDKTHLHHLMIRSGIPYNRVVNSIWILSALMSSLAFVLFRYDSWVMLLVLLIVMASIGIFIENLRIIKLRSAKK